MTISVDTAAAAALASKARGAQWLAELDFIGGTVYFTTNPISIVSSGHTYVGLGNVVDISTAEESEDPSPTTLTMSFSIVNEAMLAATLGSVESYRGKAARLYLQLTDDKFQPVGAPVPRWAGYMGPISIDRGSPSDGSPGTGTIKLPCSRAGLARSRNNTGLRLSQAQQQLRFPGDLGLEYIITLINRPTLWLSKAFQQQT